MALIGEDATGEKGDFPTRSGEAARLDGRELFGKERTLAMAGLIDGRVRSTIARRCSDEVCISSRNLLCVSRIGTNISCCSCGREKKSSLSGSVRWPASFIVGAGEVVSCRKLAAAALIQSRYQLVNSLPFLQH